MKVLIDTNILLDVVQRRAPHHEPALRLWKLVEERVLIGFVSAISFNNIHYIVRKQAGSERARDAVIAVRKTFEIVPLDEDIIDRAVASPAVDFEDAIQAAAAVRVSAAYIVTRNITHFSAVGVQAVNAEDVVAIVEP